MASLRSEPSPRRTGCMLSGLYLPVATQLAKNILMYNGFKVRSDGGAGLSRGNCRKVDEVQKSSLITYEEPEACDAPLELGSPEFPAAWEREKVEAGTWLPRCQVILRLQGAEMASFVNRTAPRQ